MPLMGGLIQREGDWAGCGLAQSPPRCTKCNSQPIRIDSVYTNFRLFDVALLPLHSKGLNNLSGVSLDKQLKRSTTALTIQTLVPKEPPLCVLSTATAACWPETRVLFAVSFGLEAWRMTTLFLPGVKFDCDWRGSDGRVSAGCSDVVRWVELDVDWSPSDATQHSMNCSPVHGIHHSSATYCYTLSLFRTRNIKRTRQNTKIKAIVTQRQTQIETNSEPKKTI